jgi:D-alanyl-D-alanine carboxypeptidase/D-alanyl-D-alanine-endopeptidase (penicillin-binding protein 4)
LAQIVQYILEVSDNEGAEVLARHVAIHERAPASFRGAARSVLQVVSGLGVPLPGAVLHDGSGLSRHDRLAPRTLVDVLAVDAQHADLSVVPESLPVAGFSGSLTYRFQASGTAAGLGAVRAKTGTLTGVHGYAGVVTSRDGAVMTFAVVADRVRVRNTLFARDQLDRITSALAACRCS